MLNSFVAMRVLVNKVRALEQRSVVEDLSGKSMVHNRTILHDKYLIANFFENAEVLSRRNDRFVILTPVVE